MNTPSLVQRLTSSSRARWWLLAFALVLLSLASSAISLRNGFTYDDVYIIQKNGSLHSLHEWWRLLAESYWPKAWGGEGYRPLTTLAFAVQWWLASGSPWVFHLVNVVLYAATGVALFWAAGAMLPRGAAWLAAALFAVHPVHVEAVANIVGQSELMVGLLLIIAVGIFLHRRGTSTGAEILSIRAKLAIAACYALALMAKEHGIVLPALLFAAEATVVRDERPWRARLVALRPFALALAAIAVAYLWARTAVLPGSVAGFQPFIVFQSLGLDYTNRVLTMLGVVPDWVRLLLWPARLTTEYAPPAVNVAQGFAIWQLPGFLILLGVLGLAIALVRQGRRAAVATFGIAWLCIVLLPSSNFVVPAGIILSERTLFLPSAGAMLVLAAIAAWAAPRLATQWNDAKRTTPILLASAVGAILVAGAWHSTTRARVWHDNETLFAQAVADAPESYRAHYMLGALLFENARNKEGERHYREAMKLFPYDPFMAYNFAQLYQKAGMARAAIPLYRWTFEMAPEFRRGEGRGNLALCLIGAGEPREAREQALIALRLGGAPLKQLREILRLADSAIAHPDPTARSKGLNRADSTVIKLAGNLREVMQITATNKPAARAGTRVTR